MDKSWLKTRVIWIFLKFGYKSANKYYLPKLKQIPPILFDFQYQYGVNEWISCSKCDLEIYLNLCSFNPLIHQLQYYASVKCNPKFGPKTNNLSYIF